MFSRSAAPWRAAAERSGSGTTGVTVVGTLAQVNADLATLTCKSAAVGADTITVVATGTHGGAATPASFSVQTVAPPTITAPSSEALVQGLDNPLTFSIDEAGSFYGETFTVTLSDANGLFSASGNTVTGSGSDSLSISGSLSDVNAALATLTVADPSTAQDQIALNVTDSLGYATSTSLGVTVMALPAEFSSPTALSAVEGVATSVGVSLAAPGAFVGQNVTATVTDTSGALSASGVSVTGSGSQGLTITGTVQQVNAALATLTFLDPPPRRTRSRSTCPIALATRPARPSL